MYPSTARSTIGGFLSGGSGGTGSIRHGVLHRDGVFVRALDVVHAVPDARLVHVEGDDAAAVPPQLRHRRDHRPGDDRPRAAPGLARAVRQLRAFEQALSVIRPFADLDPTPRLVSADPVTLSEALPTDPGIPPGRCSLRAIVDAPALDAARALVESAGGRVEDVRRGLGTTLRISMMSYNHPIEWLQKAYPDTYFHVEVQGDALVDRLDELLAVYPGGMLHIEAQKGRPIGMLAAPYRSADEVRAGFARLGAIGVSHHDCHQWYVDFEPQRTRRARRDDRSPRPAEPRQAPARLSARPSSRSPGASRTAGETRRR